MKWPSIEGALQAQSRLKEVALHTPFQYLERHSSLYQAKVFTKREDLQQVRSFKIRGAYNKMVALEAFDRQKQMVCASAGNHAQGFAYSCKVLGLNGIVFMPVPTPKQKIEQVRMFGGTAIDIRLVGDTYDEAYTASLHFQKAHEAVFIHPFDDKDVIEGQATIALEILEQSDAPLDYLFVPVGGGRIACWNSYGF